MVKAQRQRLLQDVVKSIVKWYVFFLRNVERFLCSAFQGPYIGFAHNIENCPSDGIAGVFLRASHFNPLRPFERQKLTGYFFSNSSVKDNLMVTRYSDKVQSHPNQI